MLPSEQCHRALRSRTSRPGTALPIRPLPRSTPVTWTGRDPHVCLLSRRGQPAAASVSVDSSAVPATAGTPAAPISAAAATAAATPAAAAAAPDSSKPTRRYHFAGSKGSVVQVAVTADAGGVVDVQVLISMLGMAASSTAPHLQWGMYRSSMAKANHPKEATPEGSVADARSGSMRTPLLAHPTLEGSWSTAFRIPSKLAPLHLAMSVFHKGLNIVEGPARGSHFNVPIGMGTGEPSPTGASVVVTPEYPVSCAVNFSVFARHASAMSLGLVRLDPTTLGSSGPLKGAGYIEVALDPVVNKTGDMWHICLHGLKNLESLCYAWRADGNLTDPCGGLYHSYFLLLDPYASMAVQVTLPEAANKAAPKLPPKPSDGPVLLGSLAAFTPQPFDWGQGARRPGRSLEQTVVMEVDVAAFTSGPAAEQAGVAAERRGKLLGVLDRLNSIKASGATAVLLSPLLLSGVIAGDVHRHPLSLLAPDIRLAVGGQLAIGREIKQTVKALHEAGLEVILQVELSLTAEAADASAGRLQGLRGLDAALYYRKVGDVTVLNTGHPVVRALVLEGLRHWANVYQVDGFCVLGAENLSQDSLGRVQDNPAMAEEIAHDPVLRGLKIIAAPDESMSPLLPRAGIRGFPHWAIWLQCNYRFAALADTYLHKNETGKLSELATRIAGSADLFDAPKEGGGGLPGSLAAARRPSFGLNMLSPLGDTSLMEQLGADENLERAEVLARSTLLLQFVSLGTPCFSATTVTRAGLHRLVAALSSVRARYASLLVPPLFDSPRQMLWTSANGGEPDWQGNSTMFPTNVMGVTFYTATPTPGTAPRALHLALNPYSEGVPLALPAPPEGTDWSRVIDTCLLPPQDVVLDSSAVMPGTAEYFLGPWGGLLLEAVAAPGFDPRASYNAMAMMPTDV